MENMEQLLVDEEFLEEVGRICEQYKKRMPEERVLLNLVMVAFSYAYAESESLNDAADTLHEVVDVLCEAAVEKECDLEEDEE